MKSCIVFLIALFSFIYISLNAQVFVGGSVRFNTADGVGNYANTGTWHAVVITGTSGSGGGSTYFDPQSGQVGVFTGSDMGKTTYAGY